jgi:two-component system cell cycle sensor histidine kinase/response regulator CckA
MLDELFRNAPDLISTVDAEGRFLTVNAALERLTGYTRQELVGEHATKIVAPGDVDRFTAQVASRREEASAVYEICLLTKSGVQVPAELSATAIVENGVHVGSFAIARDVRERRAVEEQLRQARKMEAVGRVARGLAHDFNNVLLVMRGFGELIVAKTTNEAVGRHAEKIVGEAERAAAMIRRLLVFTRPELLERGPLDLHEAVAEQLESLRILGGAKVDLRLAPAAGDTRVCVDRGALQQILLNLVVNARDAMPEGGTITIEAAPENDHDCLLRVRDTGRGMNAETRERVFDPFFTTKEGGGGLGLAIVYGLVDQQDGRVEVESAPGAGTTFSVHLPRAPE